MVELAHFWEVFWQYMFGNRASHFWVIDILGLGANLIACHSAAHIDGTITCIEGADIKVIVHG
jgi:hypothetical protein